MGGSNGGPYIASLVVVTYPDRKVHRLNTLWCLRLALLGRRSVI